MTVRAFSYGGGTEDQEEVFCATVPDVESFALAGDLLIGTEPACDGGACMT